MHSAAESNTRVGILFPYSQLAQLPRNFWDEKMVCTQLLKGSRKQTCPTHSPAQQGRQIAERVTATLKFSKEEKVHIRDLSGSEQPKIVMHQVQGSFRVRSPLKILREVSEG